MSTGKLNSLMGMVLLSHPLANGRHVAGLSDMPLAEPNLTGVKAALVEPVAETAPAPAPAPATPEKHAAADVDIEATSTHSAVGDANDPDFPLPTDEERSILRKVPGSIPWVSYALCAVEVAERASFYGAKTVFSNFMQFPLPEGGKFREV